MQSCICIANINIKLGTQQPPAVLPIPTFTTRSARAIPDYTIRNWRLLAGLSSDFPLFPKIWDSALPFPLPSIPFPSISSVRKVRKVNWNWHRERISSPRAKTDVYNAATRTQRSSLRLLRSFETGFFFSSNETRCAIYLEGCSAFSRRHLSRTFRNFSRQLELEQRATVAECLSSVFFKLVPETIRGENLRQVPTC